MIRAIVGANWGDEGKGKLTDMMAEQSDIVIRFQGGANAGHTIINDYGRFALHQLPSGVFYKHTANIIGNGVALNIPVFIKELAGLENSLDFKPKILVSDRAQVLMPYHILFDQYEEERLGLNQFGSTKSGIAPFYSDKYAKTGIQINELFDSDRLREKLESILEVKNLLLKYLYRKPSLDVNEMFKNLMEYKDMIAPYVCDTVNFLHDAVLHDKRILLEGQLGSLKDPDLGIYPFTTSSSTLAGFGTVGAGLPVNKYEKIVAVVK
ncbi:MAG: adenylosuccinate synthetase, partial [Clostridiales bacterium]|nr:adenylosuccinate synthetase [Clostridiales bacterium]